MSQVVGLIVPPPEIRTIIDKTADFVVKHGAQFEDSIIQTQVNNLSFNFLKKNDPYRPYYDSKIAEFARSFAQIGSEQNNDQRIEEEQQQQQQQQQQDQNNGIIQQQQQQNQGQQQPLNQFLVNKEKLLKRGEVQKEQIIEIDTEIIQQIENPIYSIEIPNYLTTLDLDIIKHTAQFVAKNGKKFLTSLQEREKQNPQFEFIKPTNQLFNFFINLVNAYQKIIQIKETQLDNIIESGKNKQNIYNQALRIFEYLKQKRQQEKKQSELENEERMLKDSIDWQDFYVAETIDFNDSFVPSYTPTQAINNAAQNNNQDNLSQPIENIPAPTQNVVENIPVPEQPAPVEEDKTLTRKDEIIRIETPIVAEIEPTIVLEENMKIKTDYKRQQNNQKNEVTKCQICGQLIPIDEYNRHLEIEMLDPKYQQTKREQQQNAKVVSIVPDPQIIQNLVEMKKQRPDIFGFQDEQFEKTNENEPTVPTKPIWDGQSATMTRTTATVAMLAQQNRRQYEEQQKKKGLLGNVSQEEFEKQQKQEQLQITNSKLAQLEEGISLEPEQSWLMKNPGQVSLNIRIPEDIERNAKLTGQLIKLMFLPINTISQVKQAISERLGMDLESSNLKSTLFKQLKGEKTLAFYNIFNGASLELSLK